MGELLLESNNNSGRAMMKSIYKYPIEVVDEQEVSMPIGAKILCVQLQYGKPCLWVEVNLDEAVHEKRKVFVHGTGNRYEEHQRYIGTFQLSNGNFVFHVFE